MVGTFLSTDIRGGGAHEKSVENEIIKENHSAIDARSPIETAIAGAVGDNGSYVGAGQ